MPNVYRASDLEATKLIARVKDAAGEYWMRREGELIQLLGVTAEGWVLAQPCNSNFQPVGESYSCSPLAIVSQYEETQSPREMALELSALKKMLEQEIRALQVKARAERLSNLYSPEPLSGRERGTALSIGSIRLPMPLLNNALSDIQLGARVTQYCVAQGIEEGDSPTQVLRVGAQLCERLRDMSFYKVACRVSEQDPQMLQFYLCGDKLPLIPPKFTVNFLSKRGWCE